jgi:hypothetical protein
MSSLAEPTVTESLSYLDRVKVEARQFASRIKHPRREYCRTRTVAVLMVKEGTGAPYSDERLRKSGCHYLKVGRVPLYRDADLAALVKSILDRALERGDAAARPPSPALLTETVIRRGRYRLRSRKSNSDSGSKVIA